jgi:chemotaxis protein MotB
MKKRDEPEEEGSGYSWMDTYGDLVTLLLCFFVLLYSFSSLNQQKWAELVSTFSGAGGGAAAIQAFDITSVREEPIKIDAMINFETRGDDTSENYSEAEKQALLEKQEQIDETFDELFQKIVMYIEVNSLTGEMSVARTDDVIILRFNEVALFDSGKAVIRPESEETLNHVIQIISDNVDAISMVNIEGHTDNVPISTAEFKDNWDLSVKRATNTLRILLASGLLEESRLSAIGYGEFQPIAPNDTPEGRSLNRRVDFVLNKLNVADMEAGE